MFSNLKKSQETLADKLPYFDFDPETEAIWLKDGSATLSLKITPKDCSNLTDEDLEALRFGLTPVLAHLPEGAVFQALCLRERSKSDSDEAYLRWLGTHTSPDESASVSRGLLFESRKQIIETEIERGQIFQTRCYVTLRILPDLKIQMGKTIGPFSHMAFSSLSKRKTEYRPRHEILRDLMSGMESLRTGLEALGFETIAVPKEERFRVIYEWLNPERAKTLGAPKPIETASISDQAALSDLIEDKSGLSLGRTRTSIATLKSLPEASIPAVMGSLASAQVPYSLIFTVYVLSQTEERERLLRKQRMAQGMASGNAVRNLMAEAQLKDIEDTLSALISSGEKLLAASFQLVALGDGRR